MTSLILHPTAAHRAAPPARAANLRSAILAIVWLSIAAAVPVSAVFFAASQTGSAGSAPHLAPYIEAKVGRL